jgi:hypothetical protein
VYLNSDSFAATFSGPAYRSLSAVSNDIPLSHAEIEQSWTQICAFAKDSNCFRPTAGSLLGVWKAVVSASVAEDIPISSTFLVDDLWKATKDSEFPRALFDAILARIVDGDAMEDGGNSKCAQVKTFQVFLVFNKMDKILSCYRVFRKLDQVRHLGRHTAFRNADSRRSNHSRRRLPGFLAQPFT